MQNRIWRGIAAGLAFVGAMSFAVTPTQAAFSDSLFSKIESVLSLTGIDRDQIEMAKFSLGYPTDAAVVYSRAVAQDYPFFALVGAVKAAKGRNLPQVGVFTHAKCLTPITLIDVVFGQADSTIDNAQGKAQTKTAIDAASGIAAQYAKAQTAQAKQEAISQLAEVVPYFGDIPTICSFAFNTDFKAERNLQLVASDMSKDIRKTYVAFKSGDVVTGMSTLMTLGVGKTAACAMVDNAVGGGLIGRTPLLGSLARGACEGFVGTVIDGIGGIVKGGFGAVSDGLDAGYDVAKDGVCAVYSLLGGGCSRAAPPPTGFSEATKWCTPYGGVKAFSSKTNAVNEYSLICNDGSMCRAKPGQPVACATAAEMAVAEATKKARIEADFQTKLPQWAAEFDARWIPKCPDEACKAGIRVVRLNAVLVAKKNHADRPDHLYQMATHFPFQNAERAAVDTIEEWNFRALPGRWGTQFEKRWLDDCEDEQCRTAIRLIRLNTVLAVKQKRAANPKLVYGAMTPVYLAAEAQARTAIAETVARAAEFNKTNTQNAGIAWELLNNAIWGKQCADAQCAAQVKQLASQMRIAANLLQMAKPNESSMAVQGTINQEYAPKFKAAVDASKARVAALLGATSFIVVTPNPGEKKGPIVFQPIPQGRPTTGTPPTGGRPAPTPPPSGGRPPPRG